MNLIKHAKKELGMIYDKKSLKDEYNKMTYKDIMELIKVFSKQEHSGFSANYVRTIFNELASFKNLTPITNNPDEWMEIAEDIGGVITHQNTRKSTLFSNDNLNTYYDIDEEKIPMWKRLFIKNNRGMRLHKLK